MVDGMIEEEMKFPFEFISPTIVSIEETSKGVAIVKGTLLAEGISTNGNLYTIDEMANIAQQAIGTPIYVGTMIKRDPNTGLLLKGMHANIEKNRVGEIINAFLTKVKNKIKFVAEVANTVFHPDIIGKIKKGWGVSIGGTATRAKHVYETQSKRVLTKIMGLLLNHVQLIPPHTKRGQQAAQVEYVEIQETMIMCCDTATGVCHVKQPELKVKRKLELKLII